MLKLMWFLNVIMWIRWNKPMIYKERTLIKYDKSKLNNTNSFLSSKQNIVIL